MKNRRLGLSKAKREMRDVATSTAPNITLTDMPKEVFMQIVDHVLDLVRREYPCTNDSDNDSDDPDGYIDYKKRGNLERYKQRNMLQYVNKWTFNTLRLPVEEEVNFYDRTLIQKGFERSHWLLNTSNDRTLVILACGDSRQNFIRLTYKASTRKTKQLSDYFESMPALHKSIVLSRWAHDNGPHSSVCLSVRTPLGDSWDSLHLLRLDKVEKQTKADVDTLCIEVIFSALDAGVASLALDAVVPMWNLSTVRRLDIDISPRHRYHQERSRLFHLLSDIASSLQVVNFYIRNSFDTALNLLPHGLDQYIIKLPRLTSLCVDARQSPIYTGYLPASRPNLPSRPIQLEANNLDHLVLIGNGIDPWKFFSASTLKTFSLIGENAAEILGWRGYHSTTCDWIALARCPGLQSLLLQLNEKQYEQTERFKDLRGTIRAALKAITTDCTAPLRQLVIVDSHYVTPGYLYELLAARDAQSKQLARLGLLNCVQIKEEHMTGIRRGFPDVQIVIATNKMTAEDPIKAVTQSFPTFDFAHLAKCERKEDCFRFI